MHVSTVMIIVTTVAGYCNAFIVAADTDVGCRFQSIDVRLYGFAYFLVLILVSCLCT